MVFAPTSKSLEQKRSSSNVLNAASNGQLVPLESATKPKLDLVDTEKSRQSINHFNTQHATTHTATAAATAASFNFTGCSYITINYICKGLTKSSQLDFTTCQATYLILNCYKLSGIVRTCPKGIKLPENSLLGSSKKQFTGIEHPYS